MQCSPFVKKSNSAFIVLCLFFSFLIISVDAFASSHREQRLDGVFQAAEFGYSTTIGDFNGDGFGDLAVGESSYGLNTGTGTEDGRVYVYYGAGSGLPAVPDWVADDDTPGGSSYFGGGVGNAGDVNGDGYDDLLVGAAGNWDENSVTGFVYLFLGSENGLNSSSTTSLETDWGVAEDRPKAGPADAIVFISPEPAAGDKFGWAVTGIRDVNGDTCEDIAIGAYAYNQPAATNPDFQTTGGAVFIYYTTESGGSCTIDTTADLMLGVNQTGAQFGKSLAAVDVDGNGLPDLLVGADKYDTVNSWEDKGAAFLYMHDGLGVSPTYPATADWYLESDMGWSGLGASVASAGNVNGDVYEDIVIGAWGYSFSAGAAFVFHGQENGLTGVAAPADADWQGDGPENWTGLGTSVAGGDLNGDGISDILAGGDLYSNPVKAAPNNEGYGAIFDGALTTGLSTTESWSYSPAGIESAEAHYGAWVRIGDIDGDLKNDYVISAYRYDVKEDNSDVGAVHVYLSRPAPALVVSPTTGLSTQENGETTGFDLTLNGPPSANVTVNMGVTNSNEGTLETNQVTFTSNNWNVAQEILVSGKDDNAIDGDQTFDVTFGVTSDDAAFNAIGTTTPNLVITNIDDDVASVVLAPDNLVTEFNLSEEFSVSLTSIPQSDVTISLISSDALQGVVSPAALTFTPGNWNVPQIATVTGTNENIANNAYTIDLAVTSIGEANYDTATLPSVNVVNRVSTVSVSATTVSAIEATGTGVFTISRDGNTENAMTVSYAITGTAESGTDYQALTGSETIPAGQASVTVDVIPVNDAFDEPEETVIMTMTDGSGYVADTNSATVSIIDDDDFPAAVFSADQNVSEGSLVTVTVTLSGAAPTYPVEIPFTIGGTASASDHDAVDGVITITSGTNGMMTFNVLTDTVLAETETVTVTMGAPTNAVEGSKSLTTISIVDTTTTNNGGGNSSGGGGGGGALTPTFIFGLLLLSLLMRCQRNRIC